MSQLSLYSPPVNTSRLVSKVTQNVLTSPEIAIVELIANAWDAGATIVNIHWPEDDHDFFSIEDNGIGMTDDDFKNHWCHIGYNRRQVQQSQITIQILQDGKKLSITRTTYGKNGIGKFAAFCFASKLNTPPAKAGGFTVATKVAFRLKPVWPLLKQAEVIPPQFGRFHLHLPVA